MMINHIPLCRACSGTGENGANVIQLFAEFTLALRNEAYGTAKVPPDESLTGRSVETSEGKLCEESPKPDGTRIGKARYNVI